MAEETKTGIDLTTLEVTPGQTGVLRLRHPVTDQPLAAEDGRPMTITLVGPDSEEYRKCRRELQSRTLARMQRGRRAATMTAEQMEEQGTELLVACTKTWDAIIHGGIELECTPHAVRELYTNTGLSWIREQVDEYVNERANFLGESQTG